jgi:hypothetical protein
MLITVPSATFSAANERGCVIALVVVSHRSAAALLQWQAGLGAVQGLDLTLLDDTHHDRVLGWIQIES